MKTYTLRGLDIDGKELWYTGRSGQGFVSPDQSQAFTYTSIEAARCKAMNFNRMTAIHGVRFTAIEQGSLATLKDKLSCEHTNYTTIHADGSFKCSDCGGVFWNDGSDAEYYATTTSVNADYMSDGITQTR